MIYKSPAFSLEKVGFFITKNSNFCLTEQLVDANIWLVRLN